MDVIYETVEEFLGRGGVITYCRPHRARGAQRKQKIKVPNTFDLGHKAFSTGTGVHGVSRKTVAGTEEMKEINRVDRSHNNGCPNDD